MHFADRPGRFFYLSETDLAPVPPSESKILLEDDDHILLEDDSFILLEA